MSICPACGQALKPTQFSDDLGLTDFAIITPRGVKSATTTQLVVLRLLLSEGQILPKDVAKHCGMTIHTVKVHVSHLRELLEPLGYTIPRLPAGRNKFGLYKVTKCRSSRPTS